MRMFPLCLVFATVWVMATSGSTWAADGTWTLWTQFGNWSDSSNWLNSIVADGTDKTATFKVVDNPGITVHLDSSRTIGNLSLPGIASQFGGNWTIDNGGKVNNILTLAVSTGTPIIDVGPEAFPEISAKIAGTQGFSKQNSGYLYLSAANTYSGTTYIDGGGLCIASDASLGNSKAIVFGTYGNVLQAGTAEVIIAATRTITLGRNDTGDPLEISFDSYGNHLTITGTIDGPGMLHKVGDGTMTLTGSNSYLGDTQIDQGILSINSDAALGGPIGRLRIPGTASLRIDSDVVLPATRTIMLGDDGTATFDSAGHQLTINGPIIPDPDYGGSGTATLVKNGAGTLTLAGLLTHIGGTTVNEGTLTITNMVGINTPDASVSVFNDATLNSPSIVCDTLTIGGTGGTAAVPEPGTLILLTIAGLLALIVRKHPE